MIIDKGEFSTSMFIIQMGEAEVISSRHSPPVILKEGDIFGEVCLSTFCVGSSRHILLNYIEEYNLQWAISTNVESENTL